MWKNICRELKYDKSLHFPDPNPQSESLFVHLRVLKSGLLWFSSPQKTCLCAAWNPIRPILFDFHSECISSVSLLSHCVWDTHLSQDIFCCCLEMAACVVEVQVQTLISDIKLIFVRAKNLMFHIIYPAMEYKPQMQNRMCRHDRRKLLMRIISLWQVWLRRCVRLEFNYWLNCKV